MSVGKFIVYESRIISQVQYHMFNIQDGCTWATGWVYLWHMIGVLKAKDRLLRFMIGIGQIIKVQHWCMLGTDY